jgi:hypothetical protein
MATRPRLAARGLFRGELFTGFLRPVGGINVRPLLTPLIRCFSVAPAAAGSGPEPDDACRRARHFVPAIAEMLRGAALWPVSHLIGRSYDVSHLTISRALKKVGMNF